MSSQLALIPDTHPQPRAVNNTPTRAPNPRATEEWARRSMEFAAANPDVFNAYIAMLDDRALNAERTGDRYIAPRIAWEGLRCVCKFKLPNAFQAAWTHEWQRLRPEWAGLVRNGRGGK